MSSASLPPLPPQARSRQWKLFKPLNLVKPTDESPPPPPHIPDPDSEILFDEWHPKSPFYAPDERDEAWMKQIELRSLDMLSYNEGFIHTPRVIQDETKASKWWNKWWRWLCEEG
jgi:hypothetical protein